MSPYFTTPFPILFVAYQTRRNFEWQTRRYLIEYLFLKFQRQFIVSRKRLEMLDYCLGAKLA